VGDYINNTDGAMGIRLYFNSVDLESDYDFVHVNQCADTSCARPAAVTGSWWESWDQAITVSTGFMLVTFTSDPSATGSKFSTSWTSNGSYVSSPSQKLKYANCKFLAHRPHNGFFFLKANS
jgi:hypothetical protein